MGGGGGSAGLLNVSRAGPRMVNAALRRWIIFVIFIRRRLCCRTIGCALIYLVYFEKIIWLKHLYRCTCSLQANSQKPDHAAANLEQSIKKTIDWQLLLFDSKSVHCFFQIYYVKLLNPSSNLKHNYL